MASKPLSFMTGTDLAADPLGPEVAPAISVTTTFRHPEATTGANSDVSRHVYSRYSQPVRSQLEHVLSHLNRGYAITYASGLAAAYAALVFFHPKRVAITGGYHGCHATIELYKRSRGGDLPVIDLDDHFQAGDLCWLETPVNPTGESRDIKYYANKAHAAGGTLMVDSTFAPPPLQYPFKWGADCVLHSGSKYLGGHSDLLGGILVVKTLEEQEQLLQDRIFSGSVMGSLETWLLLRSLKTLHLRVVRQSETATLLAQWLHSIASTPAEQKFDGIPGGIVTKVYHSSLQKNNNRGFEPLEQMEGGWNATFAILLSKEEYASTLPHKLKLFTPATSLGGVESSIEQRVVSDLSSDPRMIRISVGLEDLNCLKEDLRMGLRQVVQVLCKL